MSTLEEQLKKEARAIRLTKIEKRAMRAAVFARMAPAPRVRVRSSLFVWNAYRLALPVLAILVVMSGTAYAAQGSLPGDPLYPIKINVTEPVEVALATTPEAQVQIQEQLAGRRVAEAQTLAARGTLDATTTAQLEDNFSEHAAQAIVVAQQVDEQDASSTVPTIITEEATSTPATAPATTTSSYSAIRVVSSGSITVASSSAKNMPTDTDGLAAHVQTSLDAQAQILSNLKLHVEEQAYEHGRAQIATSTATTTTTTTKELPEQRSEHEATSSASRSAHTDGATDSEATSSLQTKGIQFFFR